MNNKYIIHTNHEQEHQPHCHFYALVNDTR